MEVPITTKIKYSRQEEALFNEALRLRDQGKYLDAIKILKKLIAHKPQSIVYNITLGGFYFNIDKYYSSLHYFKSATELHPKSELASLGYYHSLVSLGFDNAGFKEIYRFMRISKSDDYIEIIKELYNKRKSKSFKKHIKLIEKMHSLI